MAKKDVIKEIKNGVIKSNNKSITIVLFAPGVNAKNLDMEVNTGDDKYSIWVEATPTVESPLQSGALDLDLEIDIDRIYNLKALKAKLKDGLITLTAPVVKENVTKIQIDTE